MSAIDEEELEAKILKMQQRIRRIDVYGEGTQDENVLDSGDDYGNPKHTFQDEQDPRHAFEEEQLTEFQNPPS